MLTLLLYLLAITSSNGLKLDLIHRRSSISPREHFLNSASSYHNIKLEHQNTAKVETSVIPNGGDYLIKVSVGTPPVDLVAAASLANDLTWFQCEPCDRCYQQRTPIFNPEFSKTYERVPCDSTHCSDLDSTKHISCNQKYNECRYWYSYGNGTSMTMGVMGSDSFSFASTFNSTVVFGCGFEQSGLFDWVSSGLVGLGGGPLSLVSQMGPGIGYRFSYCLAPHTSNHTSILKFGPDNLTEVTEQQQQVTTPYFTRTPPSFYNLNLTAITIGSKSLTVERDLIIDIGTTLTYLNPSIFSSLKAMVNEVIGVKPLPENQSDQSMLCYDTRAGSTLTPPDIDFHFSGGYLTLKAENIFFESNGVVCLSIVMSEEDGDPMVLGNMAQVNLQVEFDLLNKTLSFSHKDCAHDQGA